MDVLNEFKGMLYDEIEDFVESGKSLTPTILERLHLVTDTIKNISKISMLEDYDATASYYGSRGKRRTRSSRSYDRGRDDTMFDKLQQMMDEAPTQDAKDAYQCAMDVLGDMR